MCPECKQDKPLTPQGICFRCKISGLGVKGPCKNCGKAERISQKTSVKRMTRSHK